MAIRIIKEGKLPEEEPKQATCDNCKSKLEYQEIDVRIQDDRDGRLRTIVCPLCTKQIYV